jgi:hypothetical protein
MIAIVRRSRSDVQSRVVPTRFRAKLEAMARRGGDFV